MTDFAIAMKDELLKQINGIDTPGEAVRYAETHAIPLFIHSEGLWVELRYAYKAAEILDRLQLVLVDCADVCSHWKTCEKLAELIAKVRCIADRYRKLQQDKFWDGAPTVVV